MTEALDTRAGLLDDVRAQPFPWWTILISGILAVALGVTVLVWPDVSLRLMAGLVGVWLFIAGLARILGAFLPGSGSIGWHVLSGIVGVLVLIGGLLCLRNLVTRLAVLAFMFSATWILTGLAGVLAALRMTGSSRAALMIAGLLTMVAGTVLLFTPSVSLATLILLTGIGSLVVGLTEIILAFVLRRTRT
jgi:uncharacterized membrane protein HdeD (DUF308 family)